MFSEAGIDMQLQSIQALLEWLKGYYRSGEGAFRTRDKPISNFVRHISAIVKEFEQKYGDGYWATIAKTSVPVLRYHLYHLVEDDWLTYYSTRIACNMLPEAVQSKLSLLKLEQEEQWKQENNKVKM